MNESLRKEGRKCKGRNEEKMEKRRKKNFQEGEKKARKEDLWKKNCRRKGR